MKTAPALFRSTLLTVLASSRNNVQAVQQKFMVKAARCAGLLLAALAPLAALQAQSTYTTPYTFTTLAGTALTNGRTDGTGPAAHFNFPFSVAVDGGGNVYVADSYNNSIRLISSAGVVTTIAGDTAGTSGFADGLGNAARFNQPDGIAVDGGGTIYVADRGNNTIRMIQFNGTNWNVSTLAGTHGTTGHADGQGAAASFNQPYGLAVDGGGIYVADSGNSIIRQIGFGGYVTTLAGTAGVGGSTDATGPAAKFITPFGVATDGNGHVYVADTGNNTVRMISSGGVVTTLAGLAGSAAVTDGTGSAARFNAPYGIAADSNGNVFVADQNGQTIRVITSGGVVSTLAGSAGLIGHADGTGQLATFNYPDGLAVDPNGSGNLYVADNANSTIRAGTPPASVSQVLVFKGTEFVQITAGSPVVDPKAPGPNYGGPYSFRVNVQGIGLGGITAPVITLAAGSTYPTDNSVRHNGGVLAFSTGDQSWNYGVDAGNFGTTNLGYRDTAFAVGTYHMVIADFGASFDLNFPTPGTYPVNTPSVTLTGGSWVAGKYVIDVTHDLTVTTNSFTNFNQNADGAMELQMNNGPDVFAFYSDNHAAPNSQTFTIPGGTLSAGQDYRCRASFYALMDKPTVGALPGSLNASVYSDETQFVVSTITAPTPGAKATFYRVGHLNDLSNTGQNYSEVRDATKTGGVIYAVGNSIQYEGSTVSDTGFLWTSTNGMTAIPNIVDTTTVNPQFVTASAITPDAAFISGRVRDDAGGNDRHATRTTVSGMTNLQLGTLPGFLQHSAAIAMSSDGSVMYGFARYVTPGKTKAVRFTASGPSITAIPFLNGGDDTSGPASSHGTSFDGTVMVGTSSNSVTSGGNPDHVGNQAFRYVYPAGTVTAIPFLSGGTWNNALTVSPDGNLTLVAGNSTAHPNGEVYLHNASGATTTSLGAPSGYSFPTNVAGMTSDGSVIAVTFNAPSSANFIHNASGWHDMTLVLASAGVTLNGWAAGSNTAIWGLSADGTLMWGSGTHNGAPEGFVIEFNPGFLAGYGATAANDFNGDGKSDILWENTVSGDHYLWFMNGSAITGAVDLGVVSTDWRIGGAGDFDGDGKADILWQNTVSGDRYIWFMNGSAITSAVDLGVISTDWRIGGLGDLNGDGKADMLWENTSTGDRYIWFMNGSTITSAVDLGITSTDWRISGTGDFNGDGKADILWENTVTGDRYIWFMNGSTITSAVDLGIISTNWRSAN